MTGSVPPKLIYDPSEKATRLFSGTRLLERKLPRATSKQERENRGKEEQLGNRPRVAIPLPAGVGFFCAKLRAQRGRVRTRPRSARS